MSQTARTLDVDVDTATDPTEVARPHLAAVPRPAPDRREHPVAAASTTTEPNTGRWALIGYALGFLTSCIGITVLGTLGGLEVGSSFGLGVFVGMWGGGGFGCMLGATIPLARHIDGQHQRPRPSTLSEGEIR